MVRLGEKMKDVIFTINANTRKVTKTKDFIGINGENLQGNIIVDFADEFIDGYAYLEVDFGTTKGFIGMTKVDSHYVLPIQNSLLAVVGKIYCQIRIDVAIDANTMSVFKSEIFDIPVLEAINAQGTVPEEYPTWVENADLKLAEVDTAIARVDTEITRLQNVSVNANMIINSGFWINQRNITSMLNGSGYMADRWYKFAGGNYMQVDIINDEVTITAKNHMSGGSYSRIFGQFIEIPKSLIGEKVTFSLECKTAISGYYAMQMHAVNSGGTIFATSIAVTLTSTGRKAITWTIPENTNLIMCDIIGHLSNAVINEPLTTKKWKFEVGEVSTPYTTQLIAEELPKCQRYGTKIACRYYNVIGMLTAGSATEAFGIIPIPTTQRVYNGTVSIISGDLTNLQLQQASRINLTNITFTAVSENAIKVTAKVASGLTVGGSYALTCGNNETIIFVDAEIY